MLGNRGPQIPNAFQWQPRPMKIPTGYRPHRGSQPGPRPTVGTHASFLHPEIPHDLLRLLDSRNSPPMARCLTVRAELSRRRKGFVVMFELPLDPVFTIGHFTKLSNLGQRPEPRELLYSVDLKTVSGVVPYRLTGAIRGQF